MSPLHSIVANQTPQLQGPGFLLGLGQSVGPAEHAELDAGHHTGVLSRGGHMCRVHTLPNHINCCCSAPHYSNACAWHGLLWHTAWAATFIFWFD